MNLNAKMLRPSDLLATQFLEKAKELQASIEFIKVLKSRTYQIVEANVLLNMILKNVDTTIKIEE